MGSHNVNPACQGKVKHPTKIVARKYAAILRKQTGIGEFVVYKCKTCGGWHVGRWARNLVKSAISFSSKKNLTKTINNLKERD